MVRKRTRASRKFESEDEGSDTDLDIDSPQASPAPKKYSLRQRKRPMFVDDFDYDEEEEVPPKVPSDDDEYRVEEDLEEARSAQMYKTLVRRPRGPSRERGRRKSQQAEETLSTVDIIESGIALPADEMPDDSSAVDFEDMIRADVVMNRNRIDYDNVINKTEIKVQPFEEDPPLASLVVRRGRPRKARSNIMYDENFEREESSENNELVVAIDPSLMLEENDKNSIDLHNGVSSSSDDLPLKELIETKKEIVEMPEESIERTTVSNGGVEKVEKDEQNNRKEEEKAAEKEKEKMQFPDPSTITDEELLNNCHIETEVKFEEYNKEDTYDIFEDPKYNDDDCDDVILIEPHQEVIVLDDD